MIFKLCYFTFTYFFFLSLSIYLAQNPSKGINTMAKTIGYCFAGLLLTIIKKNCSITKGKAFQIHVNAHRAVFT